MGAAPGTVEDVSKITDEVNSRGSKIRRDIKKPPDFPEWWPLAQIVLGVVVAFGLLWALVFSGGEPDAGMFPGEDVAVAPVGPPTTLPADDVSDPDLDVPSPDPDVAGPPQPGGLVVDSDGEPVDVPAAAVARAQGMLSVLSSGEPEFVRFVVVGEPDGDELMFDVLWVPAGEEQRFSTVRVRRDAAGVWLPG